MPKGGKRAGAGRKKTKVVFTPVAEKVIDYNVVEQMAAEWCSQTDIGHEFNLSRATIDRLRSDETFQEFYQRGLAKGRNSLRRVQWMGAKNGNPALAIWLGKQGLGQRDVPDAPERAGVKSGIPDWLQKSIKAQQSIVEMDGSTTPSPPSDDSTKISVAGTKDSVVQ